MRQGPKEASRACSACRLARTQAEETAAAARKAQKSARMNDVFKAKLRPRLPDGAQFSAVYDATAIVWTGTLLIEGVSFVRSASSLRKLLHTLDSAYRLTTKPPMIVDVEVADRDGTSS